MLIPWEDAAARIDELMREGRYIPRIAFENALDNERRELADKLWDFYRDDMHHIPEEWKGEKYGHPEDVDRIRSLLENDTERQAIRDRLEADVTAWLADTESRSWHNPRRLLKEMNAIMHPAVIYPTADKVDTKAFTYFITQDEIDSLLTHGGHFSEGKMRFLSFFLHDHDTKEKIEFVKREYGHGGGTWGQTNGWHNAEPGKGVNLKRGTLGSPEAEVNLKWPAVIKRTEQLIGSGQYMTREELDNIPSYERLMLARKLNNFYYTLPEEYERPFPGNNKGIYPNEYTNENGERTLNFHYPYEAEWQAIRDLLDNPERVESLLARMQYIFDNTPEEDRHFDYKKAGIEALTAYHNGTYTLFPGLDNLPEPGTVQPRRHSESVIDLSERGFGEIPQATEQMTLFGIMEPQLPSVNEQIAKIDQSLQQEAADADAPFLNISEADKARIAAQFSENPRSREAANLVREVYGDSLGMPLPQAIKRITDLAENGAFSIQNDPYTLFDKVRDELSERGFAVSGELIEDALNEYNAVSGKGDFQDIADFIENEYLTEELEPEYEPTDIDSPEDTQSEPPAAAEPAAALISEPSESAAPVPVELDFDTVAQTVLERVMLDADYANTLTNAQNRAALRYPLTVAIDKAVLELDFAKQYYSDDDFNDNLFDFVLKQSWERRQQAQSVITPEDEKPKPNAEKLLSENGTDYYLFYSHENTETPADLSHDTLSLITEKADKYIICADVCYLSVEDMERYGVEFRKMPRDFELLPESVQEKIAAIKPEYAKLLSKTLFGEISTPVTDAPQAQYTPPPLQITPPPVFFVDWEKAKYDFDLNFYNDRDIVGYDKSGVEHRLGRSGSLTYVTQTGAFWGGNEVPGDIYEQINAYKDGKVTDEQVRANYLAVLEDFRNYRASKIEHLEIADVLSNGLFKGNAKDAILTMLERNATNGEIAAYLTENCEESDSMTLANGWSANFAASKHGVYIEITDLHSSFSWAQIAPILRALELQWRAERTAEHIEPSVQEPPRFIEKPIENVADVLGRHPAFDRISESVKPYGVWDTVSGDWVRDSGGHIGFNSELGAGADAEQLNAEHAEAPTPELPVTDTQRTPQPSPQQRTAAANFRITDDHLGEGGAKTKFRYNIEAIKTLQAIEFEKRSATPEEQQTLSRYVGWGGIQQAFDPNNKQWENEYLELNMLLSPEEWESARASVLNAHYTSPTVIKAIYGAVERMGFKSGNILEPACGVGNFFGLLPDSMKAAKLYGVELDSVTARIAKQLYPKAAIQEMGYEKTDMPDSFFDLAIGNVPFGDYGIADKRYDKHHFKVHDYFFGKTLDQVRPGGVIAFITSKGTLDKKNPEVRKYIAQRAELLGAVRLPNTAFLKNAGTEVTSDIIFLQKRDRPLDIEPDWVHLGMTEDGIPVNRYFLDNPEMMLGRMTNGSGTRLYGNENSTTCEPFEGADLAEQLKTALSYIQGEFTAPELDDLDGVDNHAIPADSHVKNFSYALITPATEPDNADGQIYAAKIGEGQVYFRENSLMYPVDLPATTLERIKGMISLRDCVHRLIQLQLDDHSEAEISAQQQELNDLYDSFIAEFGLINSTANNRAFNADSSYYLLSSLEILDEEGNLARKADMFTKRTIKQKTVITHVDTASEALAVSLGEKACVDLNYMSGLTGFSVDRLISDLQGVIFCDVGNPNRSLPPFDPDKMKIYEKYPFVTAGEYLSGNVREKLAKAKQFQEVCGDSFHGVDVIGNITALEAVMPKDLDASEIAVRLGSTWIDPEYVQQFMYELLNTSYRNQQLYRVNYFPYTGLWQVSGKGRAQYSDVSATATYGTTRMNAYEIIDDTLNLRDVRVYDYKEDADGRQVRVLNKKETMLAQQRQDVIKQAFKDWIWKNPERRQTLVQLYNERFNSVRPREYDGSHIQFVGANPEITFLKHQEDAVARQMYGGNTLLAHVVGAGKTFEMVAAAMESKRLGLCQKSLFAVPNHLTEQWAAEFLRLYPNANILVAKKKDFEMRNRKKFCAKIATGDYDAVIIGHTQMEKIPMSRERQERLLNDQLYELEQGIAELKESNGERFTIKQLEKTKKSIETRLVKLLEAKQRDDVVTFEQLGVDRLFVDEAHGFKNLFLYTKMRNVAGLSTSEAQKSSDLFMKCRYMDELTGNKGTIFATGTPISNSMTEMYTMQRYLQYDALAAKNLIHFDCWASIFGETVTSIELAPEGTGYRARTRFAQFHNLPELMCMFKEVADIQTADMLNLPVPDAKYETIVVEPSEFQKEMVQELSERAAAVHAKLVDPRDDNMLKITTDGRKIGLDQRLYNPLLSDFEGSKVNACTENVFNIWNDTRADRLTQLVFCDFSTPNKDGRFNIYDDIKAKLIERGIPEHEIAFIHDADTETRKKELFAKVRQGKVRVLFGSTFKMGAGTNVQDKLIAIHDADCPWRPADLEQRAGRIVRQGNQNAEVKIFRYATNGTFDSYLWQTVENKQKFISQIMTSKSPVRSCEDIDEAALSYAEIKALCAGNPLIAEKMNLDIEVAKLRMLKSEHQSLHYRLEDDLLKNFPRQIASVTERIEGIEKDIASYAVHKEKCVEIQHDLTGGASATTRFPGMTVCGVTYTEKEPAAKALLESCKGVTDKSDKPIGEYMGFKMSVQFESFSKQFRLLLRGNMTYQIDLGTDTFGNITRINNALDGLPKRLEGAKEQLAGLRKQVEAAKLELEKPFSLETELAEKSARLALLNADLNIDGGGDMDVVNDPDERDSDEEPDYDFEPVGESDYEYDRVPQAASFKSAKPSILDGIRSFDSSKQHGVSGRDKPAERDI